jgi:hypothetical protein
LDENFADKLLWCGVIGGEVAKRNAISHLIAGSPE